MKSKDVRKFISVNQFINMIVSLKIYCEVEQISKTRNIFVKSKYICEFELMFMILKKTFTSLKDVHEFKKVYEVEKCSIYIYEK